jgi:DNA repair exonuclease SbcCD ATPase subunit
MLELRVKIEKVTEKDTSELNEQLKKHEDGLALLEKRKGEFGAKTAKDVSPLNNKLLDLKADLGEITVKKKELELLETQVKVEKANVDSFEKMIKEQQEEIVLIGKQSEGLKTSMEKFTTIKDYIKAIKGLLKDENIKQHMISRIMPYLNKQANYYLSEVDYSFYVDIDKWMDIKIKGPGISNATYGSLSGGERRGIDLAIQLGFLDIARTQAGIFPDLLTFDELLDSSIDVQGIGEVLKIVRVKQREANGKFFIISHRSEIDIELIDNNYNVIKENGYSRVEI